jgi:hypothetical protein
MSAFGGKADIAPTADDVGGELDHALAEITESSTSDENKQC